jgi:hypothetical protein
MGFVLVAILVLFWVPQERGEGCAGLGDSAIPSDARGSG